MADTPLKTNRILSIDRFRGTVIFCMVFFQFVHYFTNLGAVTHISSHAPDENAIYILPNFAIADVIAPMFILAIGLTYVRSFRRRQEKDGTKTAVLHFVVRNLTLIGIGVTMNGVNNILNGEFEPLNIAIIILTVIVLVSGIITAILGIFKDKTKKIRKVFSTVLKATLMIMGAAGIVITTVNFIMLCIGKTSDSYGYWLVLHHIGLAGLVALPFVAINSKRGGVIRFIAGIIILLIFTLFHEGNLSGDMFASNMELVDVVPDGGLMGGIGYGAMLLLYTCFADLYYDSKKKFLIATGIFAVPVIAIVIGTFATLPETATSWAGAMGSFLPVNKGSISPSYILIAMLLSLIAFIIYDLFNFYKGSFDPLAWWGKNPILLYIIEFGFIGALTAFLGDFFGTCSIPVSIVIIAVVTALLTFIAYLLNKKSIILKL